MENQLTAREAIALEFTKTMYSRFLEGVKADFVADERLQAETKEIIKRALCRVNLFVKISEETQPNG